jgi:hypothetical protein
MQVIRQCSTRWQILSEQLRIKHHPSFVCGDPHRTFQDRCEISEALRRLKYQSYLSSN